MVYEVVGLFLFVVCFLFCYRASAGLVLSFGVGEVGVLMGAIKYRVNRADPITHYLGDTWRYPPSCGAEMRDETDQSKRLMLHCIIA